LNRYAIENLFGIEGLNIAWYGIIISCDNRTPNSPVSQNQSTEKASESVPATSKPAQSAASIDVDLTKISSTMVYSEVYNMMLSPDNYTEKPLK